MAISRETLRLLRELRITISSMVDAETRRLVEAWARAWDTLAPELEAVLLELAAVAPRRLTRADLARSTRLQQVLQLVLDRLVELSHTAGVNITTAAGDAIRATVAAQPMIIATQLPLTAGDPVSLAVRFDRIDPVAVEAIVRRTTEQITSLLRPLAPAAYEVMLRRLVRGVAVGDNPRTVAREMVRAARGGFDGGLTRALVIARTEILDAHRAAAMAQQAANRDVLAGWVWHAQLDRRTCPSCWSQHGRLHPLEEPGPLDHHQGRCARLPKVKSWRELGFNIDEPPDVIPDAQAVFGSLPREDQLAIMGRARLAGLEDGSIRWEDLSRRKTPKGWRDYYAATPVRDLVRT